MVYLVEHGYVPSGPDEPGMGYDIRVPVRELTLSDGRLLLVLALRPGRASDDVQWAEGEDYAVPYIQRDDLYAEVVLDWDGEPEVRITVPAQRAYMRWDGGDVRVQVPGALAAAGAVSRSWVGDAPSGADARLTEQ